MRANTEHPPEDPGFFVLDVLLHLHGVEADSKQLRKWAGGGRIGVAEMIKCAREAGLVARCLQCRWERLSRLTLPGIAVLRGGGFLLLGRVTGDNAVVLLPGAARPTLVERAELEATWDGGVVVLRKPRPTAIVLRRLLKTGSERVQDLSRKLLPRMRGLAKPAAAREVVQAGATAGGAAIVVLADHARKLGRAVAQLNPEGNRRSDELAFLPAALEIVETPPSPLGRAVGFSIIAIFGVALIWASIGTVDIVAIAPGKLIPSGRTKTIQPFETGVVRAIHVHDGQSVKAGDVLIELDPTMSDADVSRLKSDLMGARFDIARLSAVLAASDDPVPAFRPPDGAQPALTEMHRRFLISQTAEQKAKLASIDRQLKQKEAERATFRATVDKLKATLAPMQQRVEIREQLFQRELGSKLTYLTELQDFVGQQQEILVQESRYSEADAAIAVLIETRTKAVAEYTRATFEELAKAEQKAAGLAQDIVKAEQRTTLQRLTAPIDGIVQQLIVHTIGGVVTPAQALMMVVPRDSRLEIEAMVSNRDIGFVEVGQEAAIKIDTFSFTRYGLLQGKILGISQDAITRDKTPARTNDAGPGSEASSSEPKGQELVFAARLSIDEAQMEIENKRVNLSPGMAVTAEIKTGSRSIISYLLSPLVRYKHESMRER
ncbi:HlyD family type I secretion periplasmic adaptor subunit [Bradyrhizobium sp. LHD-71]|uniref:HlyD family type I secretion periplasmic adaptor subunit n=1 Tax=Bradyrhizobium sp. LHD-71 TaxID=3072141 RepID=UPI00280E1FD1|nr:HlyD family type I secretion periplasmic adaptor subunit [Bradyrhizobium sp. LHD-71]MDQ8728035.1 HlyD family type I secretion periplasmic adaptor subunit [Bradyrhizobium sp. LHD-71]